MSTPTLVTGEAVVLNLRPAPLVLRAAAALIDVVLLLVVLFLLVGYVVAPAVDRMDPAAAQATVLTVVVGMLVGVPLLWETASRGRSPGKLALGLSAVSYTHLTLPTILLV